MIATFLLFLSCVVDFDPAFSRWIVLPFCSIEYISAAGLLTGDKWYCLQLVPPVIGYRYLVRSAIGVTAGVAHLIRMGDELLGVLMLDSIEHIEEVDSGWQLAPRQSIWEVMHEPGILLHKWPEGVHAQLIVEWHIDGLELITAKKAFLVLENELEVILVNARIWR